MAYKYFIPNKDSLKYPLRGTVHPDGVGILKYLSIDNPISTIHSPYCPLPHFLTVKANSR